MTRNIIVILAASSTLLVTLVPTAVAESDTISTGEAHAYNTQLVQVCPDVITTWTVRLTLLDPATTDAVGLTVASGGAPPAGTALATSATPSVSVTITQSNGCRPLTLITGILADETPYELSFQTGGGPPL